MRFRILDVSNINLVSIGMIGKAGLSPNNDYSNLFLDKKKKREIKINIISIIYTFVHEISLVENCSISQLSEFLSPKEMSKR